MAEQSTSRVARLLDMVPFLVTNQGISLSELGQRFSLSEKEIYEDLNLLFVCGLPGYLPDDLIDITFDDDFVSVSNPQKFDKPRKLSRSELSILLLSLEFLKSGLPTAQQSEVLNLIEKISREFSPDIQIEAVDLKQSHEFIDLIEKAIKSQKSLSFDYLSTHSDTSAHRSAFPVSVEIGLKESYLSAIDYSDQKLKSFKFSRISNLHIDETLVKPVELGILPDTKNLTPLKARLLVKPDGFQFIEDDKSVLKILSEEDDGILIEMDYWNQDWLIRRVRSFAPNVLIIEPEGLKAEFLKRVEGVFARYNS